MSTVAILKVEVVLFGALLVLAAAVVLGWAAWRWRTEIQDRGQSRRWRSRKADPYRGLTGAAVTGVVDDVRLRPRWVPSLARPYVTPQAADDGGGTAEMLAAIARNYPVTRRMR